MKMFSLVLLFFAFAVGQEPSSITFEVENVSPGKSNLSQLSYVDALKKKYGPLESCSVKREKLADSFIYFDGKEATKMHNLVKTIHLCYDNHLPLVLSPDMVWLLICQGFSQHIAKNSEELRKNFVKHEGKKTLKVRRDDFIKGKLDNDWEGVFAEFSDQIKEHTGEEFTNLVVANFSTTKATEKAAFQVALMDSVKSYFSYEVYTLCGIPSITLEGTPADYENIKNKVQDLKKYKLEKWVEALNPILDEFIQASKGNPNKKFWQNIYKTGGGNGSGGTYINGWICLFFPYRNDHYFILSHGRPGGFPSDVCKTDFLWFYYNEKFEMQFLAGFVGISQNPITHALRPEIGWIVRDKIEEQEPKNEENEW